MTSKPKIGPMLRLVLAMGVVLQPLARPLLKRRLAKGKEDPTRWREKLGEAGEKRPDGPLIWLHGVGVGEVMALRGLIAAMLARRPDLQFLVTSSARSSAGVFAKNLPPNTRHQYLPLDFPGPVAGFLDHWQPDLAVWSDQEVWPRLAVDLAKRGIGQALVAARLTKRSAKAKAGFGAAYGDLYRLLDVRHAQDEGTAARLRKLMGDDTPVAVTGSLKAAASPLQVEDGALEAFRSHVTGRTVWLLASSHAADEAVALNAHSQLRQSDPDALLIIAPRDIARADAIAQNAGNRGLMVSRRSADTCPDRGSAVFVADSYGELGLWYRAAFAALIGGTFDDTEGHNPWEAVALGCPVIHGTRTGNFTADYVALSDAEAAWYVPKDDLGRLAIALADPNLPAMAARATQLRQHATRGLDQMTGDLIGLLKV